MTSTAVTVRRISSVYIFRNQPHFFRFLCLYTLLILHVCSVKKPGDPPLLSPEGVTTKSHLMVAYCLLLLKVLEPGSVTSWVSLYPWSQHSRRAVDSKIKINIFEGVDTKRHQSSASLYVSVWNRHLCIYSNKLLGKLHTKKI